MPQIISGPRRARSMVTPTGAQEVTRVLDFNFASDQGIQIEAVLGNIAATDQNPSPSDTGVVAIPGAQTLHLEEGTIEDIPFAAGEDADQIDTEVFFEHNTMGLFLVGATNTFGGGGSGGTSALYVPYRDPILVARNITHRGQSANTGQDVRASVLIFYRYVRFSTAELGLIFARRD